MQRHKTKVPAALLRRHCRKAKICIHRIRQSALCVKIINATIWCRNYIEQFRRSVDDPWWLPLLAVAADLLLARRQAVARRACTGNEPGCERVPAMRTRGDAARA